MPGGIISERRPHLWCLYSRANDRVIEGLLFDEARAFVSNLDAKDLEDWFAWKEEWADWKPVTAVEGLTEMIFRVMHVSPPAAPKGTADISVVRPIAKIEINLDDEKEPCAVGPVPKTAVEKEPVTKTGVSEFIVRSNRRFNKRLHITVLCDDLTFKTFSKDISVGGINLEEGLPDWVKGTFRVRISKPNSKQQIELSCCAIEEPRAIPRHRVQILPLQSDQDEKNLETWLAA